MDIAEIATAIASSIEAVDAVCPPYVTRTGRQYQPGIGPYPENKAMQLVAAALNDHGVVACGQFISYPSAGRQKCDLWLGDPLEWVTEVKMGRFRGDNGKPDDTGIKDLISPFREDRSALSDAVKLAESGFSPRKAVLVYGFDDADRPLDAAIDALEILLRHRVSAGKRAEAAFVDLRHPVFRSGRVAAWEIHGLA
jgi:hypothetical protein